MLQSIGPVRIICECKTVDIHVLPAATLFSTITKSLLRARDGPVQIGDLPVPEMTTTGASVEIFAWICRVEQITSTVVYDLSTRTAATAIATTSINLTSGKDTRAN